MTDDLWFMSIIIVGILFACGCYWAGVAYGKQEGRRIAKDTKHACQLEIERIKRSGQPGNRIVGFAEGRDALRFLDHTRQRAASHDPDDYAPLTPTNPEPTDPSWG